MDHLENARVRLNRAIEHANCFSQEVERFLRSDPFGAATETYEDNGRQCLRFVFKVRQLPPKTLGVITGDCIHNLRATLDNIVWGLGQIYPSADTSAKNDKLSFPVCTTRADYIKRLKEPAWKGINSFPGSAQALIESLQPFNPSREAHLLSVLHGLWNLDKHRSPNFMGMAAAGVSISGYNLQQPAGLSAGLMIEDGRSFGYGTIPEGGIAPGARIDLNGLEVCFHESGPAATYVARWLLYDLIQLVNDLISRFEPNFPGRN